MQEVLVNRLGGLSLPRKSVVRLTDRRDMTLDVYRGRKTTMQQQQQQQQQLILGKLFPGRYLLLFFVVLVVSDIPGWHIFFLILLNLVFSFCRVR